tara:strand:- start:5113 stop:5736 length:624 start_codon:yes stop_codon:yes gene_type:complete
VAISTFAELKTAVAGWLDRDDLTAVIPDFITLAESNFNRTIRHRKQVTRSTATIDSRYSATPADWLQTVQLILQTSPIQQLEYVTNEAINEMRAESNTANRPRYYTHVGTEIEVYPEPDSSNGYTGELVYFAKIAALSDSNTTNWLLTLSPDIYLYGSLIASAPYLRDDERLAVWGTLLTQAIADLEISNERTRGQTSVRMRAAALQ